MSHMASSKSTEEFSDSPMFISSLYNDLNADVAFVSSDGVIFKMHSKFFEAVSAGFAAPDCTVSADDPPVVLTEPAKVLEVLFQFIHPPFQHEHFHQPSIVDMNVDLFFAVATAAEKYLVYSAMNMCFTRMHYELYSSHPVQVLNHSMNHGYHDLSDKTAPWTMNLSNPLRETLAGLTDPQAAVKWTKYYDHYRQITTIANDFPFNAQVSCPRYHEILFKIMRDLANNPTTIVSIGIGNPSVSCTGSRSLGTTCECTRITDRFKALLTAKILRIPKFSTVS